MNETTTLLRAIGEALVRVAADLEEAANPVAEEPIAKKLATSTTRKKKASAAKAEEPTPEPEPVEEKEPMVAEEKGAEPVTLEQIRAVLQEKRAAGKKDKFKDLFAQFGVQRLPDVSPDDYAALFAAAEAL